MQITKNFKSREFQCPCCKITAYDEKLVDRLQILRNFIGCSITITSAYRCKNQNIKVKGYEKSLHMQGIAVDIKVPSNRLADLKKYANLVFYDSGVGYYPNHVHVDMGKYQRFNGTY